MNVKKLIAVAAVAASAMAALPSWAADRTISANYALSADETVDGVLTVESGVTVDLNGHNLTVKGLAGDGTITAGAQDLTSPDPNGERVWTSTEIHAGAAVNLFNNSYVYGNNNDTRVLVKKIKLPLVVTYDFGDGTPKKVDMYKVYFGPSSHSARAPKAWTFEGSNDAGAPTDSNATWVSLDERTSETGWSTSQETRTYTFENDTAYRYYRISFTASSDTSTASSGPYLEFVQLEYFDSSAVPEIPPELRIDVPAGAFVTNSTVSIGGNIRLVKRGEGEFVAAKGSQMYSGGNRIAAGTIKPYSNVDQLFGETGSDITVDSGATFDINGNSRCSLYHYVMNGGTVVNTGSPIGMNYAQLGDMTLLANATIDRIGFVKAGVTPLTIDLGGYVLEETINVATYIRNADITNGTLRTLRGPESSNAFYFYNSRAPMATLELGTHTGAYDDLPVSNLFLRAEFTTHSGASANGTYKVYGTFKTETTNFPLVRVMNGSTVDLKSWDGTFNVVSTSTNPNGNKLMFDDGATVTIDIAGRTPALGDCLISWEEMPQNVTFQFDAATAAGGVMPIATERGLFYGYVANAVEWAWWTGAANDGDLSNPENWLCRNAGGGVVENGLPASVTRVYLPASLDVQIPADTAFSCGVCVLSNATLAADCDLRGLGTRLEVAPNAVIDLNGHKLYARAAAFTGVCTVKGADTGHADDLTTTDASRVSSPTTFLRDGMTAANLFNNNYSRNSDIVTGRVIVERSKMPLEATYDFGEGNAQVIDAYRIWTGPINSYGKRLPMSWKFEGSNDNASWTPLDKRAVEAEWKETNMHRTYTFANSTAYRWYRITFTAAQPNTDGYLELVQLEYFHLKPTQSELHLCTVSGEGNVALANMSLSGNLRLFIEGPSVLLLSKTGQTYIGGTEICGGSVVTGDSKESSTQTAIGDDIFGEKGCEVVIRGDGTGAVGENELYFGARTGYTGYKYVLDGGTIRNPGDGVLTELRLSADSYMKVGSDLGTGTKSYAWVGKSGDKIASYADLCGHELSVDVASGKHFGLSNATLENGCVYIRSGGWFSTTNTVVATNNVSLKVTCASDIAGTVAFTDYTCLQTNSGYNSGDGVIDVYGTFSMIQRLFHGTRLHDGATIDLATDYARDDPLPTVALFAASQKGAKTLHFESGATIGVKLGNRKVSKNTPVISWDAETKPDTTVKFVTRDAGRRIIFVKKDDGLYAQSSGLMIFVM